MYRVLPKRACWPAVGEPLEQGLDVATMEQLIHCKTNSASNIDQIFGIDYVSIRSCIHVARAQLSNGFSFAASKFCRRLGETLASSKDYGIGRRKEFVLRVGDFKGETFSALAADCVSTAFENSVGSIEAIWNGGTTSQAEYENQS